MWKLFLKTHTQPNIWLKYGEVQRTCGQIMFSVDSHFEILKKLIKNVFVYVSIN